MNRVRAHRFAEPISEAIERLPPKIARLVSHAQFVAGVDPIFVGLHSVRRSADGRSFRDIAHVVYPWHLRHRPKSDQVSTVVLPTVVDPWIVIHELGHVLDEALRFDHHAPEVVTRYAQTNKREAFAEAFTAWLCPEAYEIAQDRFYRDKRTVALFEGLAA